MNILLDCLELMENSNFELLVWNISNCLVFGEYLDLCILIYLSFSVSKNKSRVEFRLFDVSATRLNKVISSSENNVM